MNISFRHKHKRFYLLMAGFIFHFYPLRFPLSFFTDGGTLSLIYSIVKTVERNTGILN